MPWNPHNLTVHSGAPHAIGAPVSHVAAFEGTQHVFHRALVGEDRPREGLVEIWWRPGETPRWDDLFANVSDDLRGFALWVACHVVEAERTQHVFYPLGVGELWWPSGGAVDAGNLCDQAGQPKLGGFGLASHVVLAEETQHVFFIAQGEIDGITVDGHVGELWWRGSDKAQLADLTKRAGAAPVPEAASLASHVVEGPFTAERSQHVFYHSGRDIIELSWGADAVTTPRNLTASSAGENEPAASAPASHVDPDGTHHVFYVADNAHIIELTWQGQNNPVARDLTAHSTGIGPAPIAISAPTSHLFRREGTHHVYYVSQGNHLIELWWLPGDDPHHEDLTAQSGDTSLARADTTPASHVFDHEGTQHVFYTSTTGEIIELWWQP